ncbi:DUF5103 domain-containing protein [Pontibacter locisalis]|uniref:DUF5103 domain-containing protein n=1 Tax=Pontibacter locisalis TaxID=1719035 RepID=A0ABW5IQS6_9BACT
MTRKSFQSLLLLIILGCSLSACVPIEEQVQSSGGIKSAQAQIRYQDFVYDESINSVQTYLATGGPEQVLNPAVTPISQEVPLILEFDRVNAGPQRLIAKLIHCNANWTPSDLNETQYLNDFNEFFITDVMNSINTRVPYVHYRFRLPRVKLSGNYLLLVSEEGGNPLLTQRVMVYQNTVTVVAKLGAPLGPGGRDTRQPVEFNVFYKDYPIVNPSLEVKAVVRQNYRWDNAKFIPRPTFVQDAQRRLEYVFFEPKDLFQGLSEFRAFDTRSLNFNGLGVQSINLQASPVEVNLFLDKSRQANVYSQEPDINGMRIYGNKQYGNGEVNGDYTWVDFELQAPEVPGAVYIMGELTNWRPKEDARLIYDIERGVYSGRLLLKQGYYNYYYALKPDNAAETDASFFEGSHFETENIYDFLIYYRPPGTRADLLIGYEEIYFNRR